MNTTTPAQELELLLQREIVIAKSNMSDYVSTMQSAAKDIARLAEQAQQSVHALANNKSYTPNLGDFILGAVERYNDAERNVHVRSREIRTLEWMLERTAALSGE